MGYELPHQSGAQAAILNAVPANTENRRKLELGDLVFYYGSVRWPESITHVGLYSDRRGGARFVIAAVDEQYGVKHHWLNWALRPSGFGYIGHK